MISRRVFLGRAGELAALGAVAGTGFSQLACHGPGTPPAPTGTFDLEITIWGLAFFYIPPKSPESRDSLQKPQAPDTAQKSRTPYPGQTAYTPEATQLVLLVAPDPKGDMERHYPRVYYDAKYDCQVEAGKFWRTVPLEGTVLDLSPFTGREREIPEIPDLLNISPFTTRRLPDPRGQNPRNLACRITLPPGEARDGFPTHMWEVRRDSTTLARLKTVASRVVWTVHGIPGTELPFRLRPLETDKDKAKCGAAVCGEPLPPLKPSGGKIELYISNVPLYELGHEPGTHPGPVPCNFRMPHFEAFFQLYDEPGPWPALYNVEHCPGPQGTPYTCLPSGGH
jgi:hypothetical protein